MSDVRNEKLSLAYGQTLGQLSELLNNIKTVPLTNDQIYRSLFDITKAAALYVNVIYYKNEVKNDE